MDLAKKYGTDKELEKSGVWQDIGDGASILVARMGNANYIAEFKRLTAPYKRQIRLGLLSDDIWQKISIECLATSILMDWKGLADGTKTIAYSRENAINMLTKYPDFRDDVSALSNEIENFFKEEKAAEAKN